MPADYKKAQSSMREELASQWGERGSLKGPVGLYLELYGEARGDIDNIVGFFLDSAGPTKRGADDGILWNDDRLAVIPLIAARWEKCSPADSRWVVHLVSLG